MKSVLRGGVVFFVLAMPALALAQQARPQAPTMGPFFRGSLGLAGLAAADDIVSVSGGGVDLFLAAGLSFGQVVLFLEVFGAATVGIDVDIEGETGSCDDCSLILGSRLLPGLGAGIFAPSGYNVSLGVHAPSFTLDIDGDEFDSDRGVFFVLQAGKDWPLSDKSALGLALRLGAGSIDETGAGLFSLAASFTYR